MILSCEQKALLTFGGIAEQPTWYINLLSWFAPAYEMQKFMSKAKLVLGDDKSKSKVQNATKKGRR